MGRSCRSVQPPFLAARWSPHSRPISRAPSLYGSVRRLRSFCRCDRNPSRSTYDLAVATNDDTKTPGGGFDGQGQRYAGGNAARRARFQWCRVQVSCRQHRNAQRAGRQRPNYSICPPAASIASTFSPQPMAIRLPRFASALNQSISPFRIGADLSASGTRASGITSRSAIGPSPPITPYGPLRQTGRRAGRHAIPTITPAFARAMSNLPNSAGTPRITTLPTD